MSELVRQLAQAADIRPREEDLASLEAALRAILTDVAWLDELGLGPRDPYTTRLVGGELADERR